MITLNIKHKSFLAVFVLVVILMVMGLLLVYQVRNILWDRTNDYTVQLVEKLSRDIDLLLGELDRVTSSLIYDPNILAIVGEGEKSETTTQLATNALKRAQQMLPSHVGQADLLIISKETRVLASTSPLLVEKYRTLGVEWINKVMEAGGESVRITGYSVSKGMNLPNTRVINIARGLFINGKYQGMMMLDIPTLTLEELCEQVEIGNDGFVSIIDSDNYVMFSTNWVDMGNQFKMLPLTEQKHTPLTGYIGGKEMFIVHTTSAFSGITVVGAMPIEEVFAPAKRLSRNTVLMMVGFAIAILMVAVTIVFTVSRPILRLADAMKKVEEGDLTIRVAEQRTDEIGVLEKGFNTMLDRVQDLVDREYRASLGEREAQLNELTAIINPHFIYNTLEAIKMRAYLNNDYVVVDMLTGLARLFRIMTHSTDRYITLEEELSHCKTYLEIMRFKEDPAISTVFEIPDELLQCYTLKFLLQPLVENSIMHGFGNQSHGNIIIRATADGDSIVIAVIDDGEGLSEQHLEELKAILDYTVEPTERPMALQNINDRIRLAFGMDFGLDISNNAVRGVTVKLTIPRLYHIPEVLS